MFGLNLVLIFEDIDLSLIVKSKKKKETLSDFHEWCRVTRRS